MEPNEAYGKTRTSSSLTRGSLRSHSVSSNSSRSNDSNSTTAGCDCAAATAATAAEVQAAAVQPGSKDGHCRSANTANTAITATAGTSTNAATLPLQDYRLNLRDVSKIVQSMRPNQIPKKETLAMLWAHARVASRLLGPPSLADRKYFRNS
jgi:hypothetical protein